MNRPVLFLLSLLTTLLALPRTARAVDNIAVSFALPTDAVAVTEVAPPQPPLALVNVSPNRDIPNPDSAATVEAAEPSTTPAPAAPEPVSGSDPLNFAPPTPPTVTAIAAPPPAPTAPPAAPDAATTEIFAQGSDSLVARAVGHAEGTRTADGGKTSAYYGHTDPGNGVWNLGSFSFQHCREAAYNCSTPEEADVHQLRRLQGQADQLQARADRLDLNLTLEEELNGIDLANQAPAAALGEPGYTEWLKKAQEKGLQGQDAILWARVSSYWDPHLQGWNAPGLGNTEANITHDQNRRMQAIARALATYQQEIAQTQPSAATGQSASTALVGAIASLDQKLTAGGL